MSRDILVSLIDPDPGQPRQHFDGVKIAELAASMGANGLVVPIAVRPAGDRFIIVHGERRWRAAKSLGWEAIRAEVCDVAPEEARWLSLVENVQRADLSPTEEAKAFQAHLAGGITQAQLGERVGKSQSYIAQKLRLLKLPDPLIFYLDQGVITEGHARQLMKLKGMYFGACAEFEPEEFERRLDEEAPEIEAWCEYVSPLLASIRPEDDPVCWFIGPGCDLTQDPAWRTLAEGCRRFYRYVAENGARIEQWESAAFWWGSVVVWAKSSVAQLSKALKNWEVRFLTAIWWVNCNGEKEPVSKSIDKMSLAEHFYELMYWGRHSDVRHSNAQELVSLPRGIMPRIAELQIVGGSSGDRGYILPSCCQRWGSRHAEYKELRRLEKERRGQ